MIFTKSAIICPPALLSLTPNILITTVPFTYMSAEDIQSLQSPLPGDTLYQYMKLIPGFLRLFCHPNLWAYALTTFNITPLISSFKFMFCMTLSSPAQYSSHSRPSRILLLHFSAYLRHARIFSIHLQWPWPCFPSACTHSIPTFLLSIVSASLVPLLASLLHLKSLLLPPTSCWPARMKLDVLLIQALSGNVILDGEVWPRFNTRYSSWYNPPHLSGLGTN